MSYSKDLSPDHGVLNKPFKIGEDFDGTGT